MLGPTPPTDSQPQSPDSGVFGADRWLVAIRWTAAIIFVVFGIESSSIPLPNWLRFVCTGFRSRGH